MATQYLNVLGQEDIDLLLNLPDVVNAKTSIDAQASGSVGFSTSLPASIKDALYKSFGLDLDTVPMRWIKGDTSAHKDSGAGAFQNTYLIYLTDSQGELIVDGSSYPITQGTGYMFSEGLSHETLNTGSEPRLLLGPMSETGFAVGGLPTQIAANGATDIIYITQDLGGQLQYKINNGNDVIFDLPIDILNTNANPANNILKVIFTTDIVVTGSLSRFVCVSDGIQFGSESLGSSGNRVTVTIDATADYSGFIQNGSLFVVGYNNIYVYNLAIVSNGSTLVAGAGWLGRSYFGRQATNNYIVNCLATGDIPDDSGGILGNHACSGGGSILNVIGCSSTGAIGLGSGGIVGKFAGEGGGTVTCIQCFTSGKITDGFTGGNGAGGIYGASAGSTGGIAYATKCYSTGAIGIASGGIFGQNAGDDGGIATADRCYSLGAIGAEGGGIYGSAAGTNGGTTSATNCYSEGFKDVSAGGIYALDKVNGTETKCYAANGTWQTVTANANLEGTPNGGAVGITWVSAGVNQPYELNAMGYTPYSTTIIGATSQLIQTYAQTVTAGQSTVSAVTAGALGSSFVVLQIIGGDSGSYGTIIMSLQTGAISTTVATVSGVYTITLRSVGSYNITTFTLTVIGVPPSPSDTQAVQVPCCAIPLYLKGYDYDIRAEAIAGNTIIADSSARRAAISYDDINKMKIAKASKRR